MKLAKILYNNPITKKFTKIIIRLDDFHQIRNEDGWNKTFDMLDDLGVRATIAVVPKYKGEVLSDEAVDILKDLEKKGWEISQHGYTHDQLTNSDGILGTWNRSEFAGVPYREQYRRILEGKKILESFGLQINTFVPPWHTFDENTIKALQELKFKVLSDGHFFLPKKVGNVLMVPTHKIWHEFLRIGIITLVLHPNEATKENLERWREWIVGFEENIMTCYEVYKWWSNSVEYFYDINYKKYYEERIQLPTPIIVAERIILKHVDFSKRKKMIDIGCGPAITSKNIADLHDEVYYLDISEKMLELAKNLMGSTGKRYIKADIINFDYNQIGNIKFDTVVCFGLASVISKDELKKALNNIHDLLTDGGVLLLIFSRKSIRKLPSKLRLKIVEIIKPIIKSYSYSEKEIRELALAVGFSDLQFYKLPNQNSLLIAYKRGDTR